MKLEYVYYLMILAGLLMSNGAYFIQSIGLAMLWVAIMCWDEVK